MAYFDCFVVAAFAFAVGWFSGAIYGQNHENTPADLRREEEPEPAPVVEISYDYDAVSSAAAAD